MLANEWGWTKSRVERFMIALQKEGMIQIKTRGKKPSIITICNYDKYQSPNHANPPSDETHLETLARHHRDTIETPYNELNQEQNILDKDAMKERRDRRLLEELYVILHGMIDKNVASTTLADTREPRRWNGQYDWNGFVIPTIKSWARSNKMRATPSTIRSWKYFTTLLESAFEKERQKQLYK